MTELQKASTAMTIASVVAEGGAMTVAQIKANRQLMREVMKELMEEGVHYGVIPGTDKPTLLKPGAELLLLVFRVSAEPIVEDLGTPDCIRYRVKAKGVHAPTGIVVGWGGGECSTDEEKYKFRATYNRREWETTPEDRRRTKYGYNRAERREFEVTQVRTNPADAANTVLKMALKRAKSDLALAVTGASDVFMQDTEEMAEWLAEPDHPTEGGGRASSPKANSSPPKAKAASPQTGKINAQQLAVLTTSINDAGITPEFFCKEFGIEKLEDLDFSRLNEGITRCKKWRDGGGEPPPQE